MQKTGLAKPVFLINIHFLRILAKIWLLEIVCAPETYRRFESSSLRQITGFPVIFFMHSEFYPTFYPQRFTRAIVIYQPFSPGCDVALSQIEILVRVHVGTACRRRIDPSFSLRRLRRRRNGSFSYRAANRGALHRRQARKLVRACYSNL